MNYIHAPARHRQSGSTMQKKFSGRFSRWEAAREVLPGYPWDGRFTYLEAKAYLDHIELTCLLCGKPYRNLGIHLTRIHQVHNKDYKRRYGLLLLSALTGTETRTAQSVANLADPHRIEQIRTLGRRSKPHKGTPA